MPTGVSPEIAAVVLWLLEHPGPGEPVDPLHSPLADLTISGTCTCGCGSVSFVPNDAGDRPIRDAAVRFADGAEAGIILWGRLVDDSRLELTQLEVYGAHQENAGHIPDVSELRTWEMRGQEMLDT